MPLFTDMDDETAREAIRWTKHLLPEAIRAVESFTSGVVSGEQVLRWECRSCGTLGEPGQRKDEHPHRAECIFDRLVKLQALLSPKVGASRRFPSPLRL